MESRFFLCVGKGDEVRAVLVPEGLSDFHKDVVNLAVGALGAPKMRRSSPTLALAWNMAEVHGRPDWIVALETLQRAGPLPFPRVSVVNLTDPA